METVKKKPPKIYECKQLLEPVCQEPQEEKFDPRSFCHSLLSKTGKVCKKTICRKFLKTNEERTKAEIVCIPRPPCKIKRHFGPKSETEDEDEEEQFFRMFGSQLGLVLNEGTVSETDILKGRFYGQDRITRDGRLVRDDEYEEYIDENGNVVRRRKHSGVRGKPGAGGRMTPFGIVQDEETAELLENLSKYLDAEGMAAVAALGGADICPCCRCTICQCRLRGITSEMLLVQRKKALLESRFKAWGKEGYVWSFDYFYKPDFEYFEKQREEREKREEMLEIEKEVMSLKMELEEDESADELFDKTRTEGVTVIEEMVKTGYGQVQATPSIMEEEIQVDFLDRDLMKSFEDFPTEGSVRGVQLQAAWTPDGEMLDIDRKGTIRQSMPQQEITERVPASSLIPKSITEDSAIGEYVRSTLRSSIESWVETREPYPEGRRPTTITGASIEPIDIAFPAAEIQGEIRIIREEKPKQVVHPKKAEKEEKKPKMRKKKEISELDVFTPVLKRKLSIEEPEYESIGSERASFEITSGKGKRERVESIELEKVSLLDDAKIEEMARARALAKKSVCDCLPGLCTCGAQHYVFKKEYIGDGIDIGIESKPSMEGKEVQTGVDYEEKAKRKDDEEDVSEKSSCVCFHPWEEEDLMKVTPAASIFVERIQMPRKPRKSFICTQPRFQKTIIIVKPEAMNFKDVIIRAIKQEGLDIIDERLVRLTPEQVAEVYSENYGSAYFPMFVQKMSSTPILILCVAGNYAVDRWKYIIGQGEVIPSSWFYPESIKRRFGIHCDIYGAMRTSADFDTARNEIRYFFPLDIIEPIIIESIEVQDYCDKYIHPTLLKALFKIVDEKPEDPLLFLAEWLLRNNPFQPHYLDSLVALAPT
ncbi:uncharacterized protein LOC123673844 [Harmonia axyridis]|uniref:uncharacterized protein LOC123673844 n=1 Tax=Harmonia axyridis TaxID=115357 RepID=UPI001E279548|nr:uncharacterized protein LOC123673844 [Harmonia axyridis]